MGGFLGTISIWYSVALFVNAFVLAMGWTLGSLIMGAIWSGIRG